MPQRGRSGQTVKRRQVSRPKQRKVSTAAPSIADLQAQVVMLARELKEAQEQQSATTEVLQVINSSPGDLAPVFDAMLEKALSLCEASFGVLCTYDGDCFRAAALRGVPARYAEFLKSGPLRPGPGNGLSRLVAGEKVVHVLDVAAEGIYRSGEAMRRALVDLGGARTTVTVPLLKDNKLLGAFIIFRQDVRPFTEKQIALAQNFAAQAVIAIENVRLINETREALERQTATADVLKVISRSSIDLATVLDTLLQTVARLCRADQVYMFHLRDDLWHLIADCGLSVEAREFFQTHPFTPGAGLDPRSGRLGASSYRHPGCFAGSRIHPQ